MVRFVKTLLFDRQDEVQSYSSLDSITYELLTYFFSRGGGGSAHVICAPVK